MCLNVAEGKLKREEIICVTATVGKLLTPKKNIVYAAAD